MPMPVQTDPAAALDAGLLVASDPDTAQERADVQKWMRTINTTLAYDAPARRNYVKCRRYARGDSGFIVDANIVGTNIDIVEAFVYAKNPDVDVNPAKAVEMPSLEAMLEAAVDAAERDPRVQQAMAQAAAMPVVGVDAGVDPVTGQTLEAQVPANPMDPMAVQQSVEQAKAATIQMIAAENLAKIKAEYDRRTRENKAFAETSELVISSLWKQGRLKDRGRPWVRSALTTGPGWLKASWQQRTAPSPETLTAINDLVQQLQRIQALQADMVDEAEGTKREEQAAELQRQLDALKNQTEPVVSRGFIIDLVTPENLVVAPGFRLADHMDAPWNAERIPLDLEEACAKYKLSKEDRAKLTKYMARAPALVRGESANAEDLDRVDVREAESFVRGEAQSSASKIDEFDPFSGGAPGAGCFVMEWEIWDRTSNSVLNTIEGLDRWVQPPWNPCTTTRFYPFFGFLTSEVDGQRHPQSPVERSAKLVDEYNRIGSAEAQHRRRIIPKTAFNAGSFVTGEAEKLEKAGIQEMVALKLTNPAQDIREILFPITYAAIDVNLYDRSRINDEIDRIWGVSEILGGGDVPGQTATAADIQQQGFQARTGSRRDAIEAVLSHLALYSLEVGRCYLTDEDVRAVAGPNAFWPTYDGAEDLKRMVDVDIRAGTTGKPNTRAEREAWGILLPQLQAQIVQYAQLVGANPRDLAESIKKLARITAERAGDRLDVDSLFPPAPAMAVDPATGQPAAPGGAPGAQGGPPNGKPGEKPGSEQSPGTPAAAAIPDLALPGGDTAASAV